MLHVGIATLVYLPYSTRVLSTLVRTRVHGHNNNYMLLQYLSHG